MTATTVLVEETITFAGDPVVGVRVNPKLVASTTDTWAPGYTASEAIFDCGWATTDANGLWQMYLTPNVLITSPANTRYLLTYLLPHGGEPDGIYINVPNTAGPHEVKDILSAAPTDLGDPVAVTYDTLAKYPEFLWQGSSGWTYNGTYGTCTAAPVVWPDGILGVYTVTTLNTTTAPGAVDAYTITYLGTTTVTYTQPAVTRNASGQITNRPAITVA